MNFARFRPPTDSSLFRREPKTEPEEMPGWLDRSQPSERDPWRVIRASWRCPHCALAGMATGATEREAFGHASAMLSHHVKQAHALPRPSYHGPGEL